MLDLIVEKFDGKYTLEQFLDIMRMLRAPNGCPWDREQTHSSIRNNFLEETYEVIDAIDRDSTEDMREELGDVLMQVVFHSIIAEEENRFDFSDVVDEVSKKLVFRHPHVFGDVTAETSEKVLDNWEKLKRTEKSQSTYTDTLKSVPLAFPALMRAQKLQKRAAKAGITEDNSLEEIKKQTAKLNEVFDAYDKEKATEIIGDMLFAVAAAARLLKVDCEEALQKSSDKYVDVFSKAEALITADGKDMKELSRDELSAYFLKAQG